MKHNKTHDYSTLLIWAAALVTIVRYAAAFIASDSAEIESTLSQIITYGMGLSGIGMGILDVVGGTYLFTGWQKKMPANGQAWSFKFKALSFFAIGLIVNGILILIPFTASRVSGNTMFHVLGDGFFLYAWAAVVNIAPYLLVGGVAVGNQIVSVHHEIVGQMTGQIGQKADIKQAVTTATDWRQARKQFTGQQIATIAKSKTGEVMAVYNLSERTARRWIEAAKRETPPPFP